MKSILTLLLLIVLFVALYSVRVSNSAKFEGTWRAVASTVELNELSGDVKNFPVKGLYNIKKLSKNHYVIDVASERKSRLISSVTPNGDLMIVGNSAVNPDSKDSSYNSLLSVESRDLDGTPSELRGVSWVFLDEADRNKPTIFRTSSIKLVRYK